MKNYLFGFILCLCFSQTNAQGLKSNKIRLIGEIEIKGEGFRFLYSELEIIENKKTGEIYFGEGSYYIDVDSITLKELKRGYFIFTQNILNGFYENETIIVEDKDLVAFDLHFFDEFCANVALGYIKLTTNREIPIIQHDINYSDSISTSMILGSQFAKTVFSKIGKPHFNSETHYRKIQEILSNTSYFIIDSISTDSSDMVKEIDLLFSEFLKLRHSNQNLNFFLGLGYLIEQNNLMLDFYISGNFNAKDNPRYTEILAEQKLIIRYLSAFASKQNCPKIASDLAYLIEIYEGK